MKRSTRVTLLLIRRIALLCVFTAPAFSQISQIDRSKLPKDGAVQSAYSDLLPIDQFARTCKATWRFPIPKADVASRFLLALRTLEDAQKQAPSNKELQIFTGLVAHLAYNLDIEEAYDTALKQLQPRTSEDFRAAWFLGIHQCQSNDPVGGMKNLLRVETLSIPLPGAFWQDYANCAGVTDMPIHAIRAYDNARKSADELPIDAQLEQIARNRIKSSSATASYPAKQVWYTEKTGDRVRFTSTVCGESFEAKIDSPIELSDITNGSCLATVRSGVYPIDHGNSASLILILTESAKHGETLESYAHNTLAVPRYSSAKPITGLPCPVSKCLTFDIHNRDMDPNEGGDHMLAVFLASEQPDYPGFRLEHPHPLPKPDTSEQPQFLRPADTLRRFDGTLFTVVLLDASEEIHRQARNDFENVLKSLVIDSK
jgi:hypothetical protein